MSMKAIKDVYKTSTSLPPAARTATTNGNVIDLADTNENMVQFIVGAITDGTHTPKLQAGNQANGSDMADLVAGEFTGTLANLASNTNQQISYLGGKRYLRAVITVASATTGGVYSATAITKIRKQP